MYQRIQLATVAVMAGVFALTILSRRFPQAGWLRPFRILFPPRSAAQRARARRASDLDAGLKFILLALVLPVVYIGSRVMLFEDLGTNGLLLVGGASALCFALGVIAIRKSRSR